MPEATAGSGEGPRDRGPCAAKSSSHRLPVPDPCAYFFTKPAQHSHVIAGLSSISDITAAARYRRPSSTTASTAEHEQVQCSRRRVTADVTESETAPETPGRKIFTDAECSAQRPSASVATHRLGAAVSVHRGHRVCMPDGTSAWRRAVRLQIFSVCHTSRSLSWWPHAAPKGEGARSVSE